MNTKMRLLIVDDESEIRDALSRHFRFMGRDVDTAGNGQEALDKLAESKFDIVISDIVMPVMNGVALLRIIRREFPMIHVIIMTGYVTQENVMACMRHGADTCVFKPWPDLREIEDAVSRASVNIQDWKGKMKHLLAIKPAVPR